MRRSGASTAAGRSSIRRRIATNVAIDHLRGAGREVELVKDVAGPVPPDPAVQGEMRASIARAFRALPAKLQVAATLVLVEERPYQEVGEALGISAAAAKSRVFRATRLLRGKLERMGLKP